MLAVWPSAEVPKTGDAGQFLRMAAQPHLKMAPLPLLFIE